MFWKKIIKTNYSIIKKKKVKIFKIKDDIFKKKKKT